MTRKSLIRVNGTLEVKFIAGVWAPKSVDKVGSVLTIKPKVGLCSTQTMDFRVNGTLNDS